MLFTDLSCIFIIQTHLFQTAFQFFHLTAVFFNLCQKVGLFASFLPQFQMNLTSLFSADSQRFGCLANLPVDLIGFLPFSFQRLSEFIHLRLAAENSTLLLMIASAGNRSADIENITIQRHDPKCISMTFGNG